MPQKDIDTREQVIRSVLGWLADDIPEDITEFHTVTQDGWTKLYDRLESLISEREIEARIDELRELQSSDYVSDKTKDEVYELYIRSRLTQLKQQKGKV